MVLAVTLFPGDDFDGSQGEPFDPYDTPALEDFYGALADEHERSLEHLLEWLAVTVLSWGILGRLRRNRNGDNEL